MLWSPQWDGHPSGLLASSKHGSTQKASPSTAQGMAWGSARAEAGCAGRSSEATPIQPEPTDSMAFTRKQHETMVPQLKRQPQEHFHTSLQETILISANRIADPKKKRGKNIYRWPKLMKIFTPANKK